MTSFTGITVARNALDDFINDRSEALPDDVRDGLRDLLKHRSAAVTCARAAELLYARRDEIGPEAKAIGAGLAVLGEDLALFGLAEDSRGSLMARVLRGQEVEAEPEPKAEYLPPEPEPEPEFPPEPQP